MADEGIPPAMTDSWKRLWPLVKALGIALVTSVDTLSNTRHEPQPEIIKDMLRHWCGNKGSNHIQASQVLRKMTARPLKNLLLFL